MSNDLFLVEDDDDHAEIAISSLHSAKVFYNVVRKKSLEEAVSAYDNEVFEIVLLDLSLPDSSGIETVERFYEAHPDATIVVLTSLNDQEVAIRALKSGALDYIPKDELTSLLITRSIRYAKERKRALTELNNKIDELAKKEEELSQSNKELEQFAYTASHDLQAPLRHISVYIDVLKKELPPERLNDELKNAMGFISSSADKMKILINDLLEFSKVGKTSLTIEHCNVHDLTTEVLEILDEEIKECSAEITVGELSEISCDKGRLSQVFQNLISNSIKYRNPETNPKIDINCRSIGADWQFRIDDNGIGISEKYHERIFHIFKRLHTSTAYPGTGIGLSICKKIIELHGGRIWVENNNAQGSSFFFTIRGDLA